jgi:hypothetical protein
LSIAADSCRSEYTNSALSHSACTHTRSLVAPLRGYYSPRPSPKSASKYDDLALVLWHTFGQPLLFFLTKTPQLERHWSALSGDVISFYASTRAVRNTTSASGMRAEYRAARHYSDDRSATHILVLTLRRLASIMEHMDKLCQPSAIRMSA